MALSWTPLKKYKRKHLSSKITHLLKTWSYNRSRETLRPVLSNMVATRHKTHSVLEIWVVQIECALSVKYTAKFEDFTKKGKYPINNFLYWLHVEMIFLIYWIKKNTSLKLTSPISFHLFKGATKFKILFAVCPCSLCCLPLGQRWFGGCSGISAVEEEEGMGSRDVGRATTNVLSFAFILCGKGLVCGLGKAQLEGRWCQSSESRGGRVRAGQPYDVWCWHEFLVNGVW